MTATRRLAAILAADVAGYSRLMGADEEGTLELGVRYVLEGGLRKSGNRIRVRPSTETGEPLSQVGAHRPPVGRRQSSEPPCIARVDRRDLRRPDN